MPERRNYKEWFRFTSAALPEEDLGWKRLIPLSLANIALTAVCKAVF